LINTKPFQISKQRVLEAYQRVKANRGAAGVDRLSLKAFEADLKNNLYKIWNRMSSGSYFPPPVKAVEIPKKNGGIRVLGIPTVADRIAQMVVKMELEPELEPFFSPDSYGYRPGKSALDAVAVTRQRSWQYDWVLELDIRRLFDSIDHELLMKAVRLHTDNRWVILYIERWLKSPMQWTDGTRTERQAGTPQGGVISPLLANLFLHYAFDRWMEKEHPEHPFARYADDVVIHARSRAQAQTLRQDIHDRLTECGLELHPDKTRIVYCKDDNRRGKDPNITFDYLGYTFRPRRAKNRYGERFLNFSPAISGQAKVKIRQTIRGWRIPKRVSLSLPSIAERINPIVRGWINYYGRFYKSALYEIIDYLNQTLITWARMKFLGISSKKKAKHWLRKRVRENPLLFFHWRWCSGSTAG